MLILCCAGMPEAVESLFRRTLESRNAVRSRPCASGLPVQGCCADRRKKEDFGSALQNLYREVERVENLVGHS